MAGTLAEAFYPSGCTERRPYRFAMAGIYAVEAALVALLASGLVSGWAAILLLALVAVPAWIATLLLTIRRLRDAGWSVYWTLLMFFIVRPLGPVHSFEQSGIDVSIGWPGLELIPLLIGLLAPSCPEEEQTI